MPKQVWRTEDDSVFETEAEAVRYEVRAEYREKIFNACNRYFTADSVLHHAEVVRDLLDCYLLDGRWKVVATGLTITPPAAWSEVSIEVKKT